MPRPAAAAPAAEFVAQSFAEPQETPADLSAPSGAAAADEQAQEDELPMMPLAAADAFAAADPVLALRAAEAEAEIVEADAAADDDADPYDLEAELGILLTSPAPAPEAELPAAAPIPAEPEIKLAAEPPAAGADFYFDDDEARPAEFAERRSADILPLAPRSFVFTEPSADATPEAADGPAALAADPIDDLLFESQMESELQALDEVAALEPEPAYAADPVAADGVAPAYVPAEAEEGPLAEERADWQPTEAEVFSDEEVLLAAPAEAETAVPAERQPEAVPATEALASEQAAEEDPFEALAAMVRHVRPGDTPFKFTPSGSWGNWTTTTGRTPASAALAETPVAAQPQPVPSAPAAAAVSISDHDQSGSVAPTASESPNVSTDYMHRSASRPSTARSRDEFPDIETVEVMERPVALADDLDIPDLELEEDIPLAADFDDFEAELANAFRHHSVAQGHAAPPLVPSAEAGFDDGAFDPPPAQAAAGGWASGTVAATTAAAAASTAFTQGAPRRTAAGHGAHPAASGHDFDDDDLDYDPMLSEDIAVPAAAQQQRRKSVNRRGLLVPAIVLGVVVLGGIGAFALSGHGPGGTPALVRADNDPVKVRPANPGGTTVPNQDNKVFQTMNGTDTGDGTGQDKLITGNEEPVDVNGRAVSENQTPTSEDEGDDDTVASASDPVAAEIAAAPKGEDRVPATNQAAAKQQGAGDDIAVMPRRVRTMVVKPDGSLMPSDDKVSAAEPQSEPATGADASALETDDAATTDQPSTDDQTASLPDDEATAAPAKPAQPAVKAAGAKQAAKASVPVPGTQAPAAAKAVQVADAGGAAAAAGGWSMQIASQPTQAAAQSSYNDLVKRYGSVIGDKGVNIVKADIAGKGTFWRVRVPAGSRDGAVSLCESYKSAGGNCFVSR